MGKRDYYCLIHNTRIKQYEKYLGKEIPDDIDQIKQNFEYDVFGSEKIPLLEAVQKAHSRRNATLDKKIVESEYRGFMIMHVYSTQKIEGSTMTLSQTKKLLEYNLSPKDTATEHIVEAEQASKIFNEILSAKTVISKETILNWHKVLFNRTDVDNAGSFRRADVGPLMGSTEYAMWPDVIPEINQLVKWHNKNKNLLNPVFLSALFHRRFELIHPFIDGNGRIGRLLALLILHKAGYPMMHILPKEKYTYIKKLETSYLDDNPVIFLKWFVSKYLRDNKRYL